MAGPNPAEIDEGIKMIKRVINALPRESAEAAELAGRLATLATLRDAHLQAMRGDRSAANILRQKRLMAGFEVEMDRALEYASALRPSAASAAESLATRASEAELLPKRVVAPGTAPIAPSSAAAPVLRIVRPWKIETSPTALSRADARVLVSAEAEAAGQRYLLTVKLRPDVSEYGRAGAEGQKLWEARVRVPLERGEVAKFRPDLPGVRVSETGDTLYGYYGSEVEARQAAEEMMNLLVSQGLRIRVTAGTWRPMAGGWYITSVDGVTYGVIRNTAKGPVWYVNRRMPDGQIVTLERGPAVGTLDQQRRVVGLAMGGK